MAGTLMLVNPRKKRRKTTTKRKTPARRKSTVAIRTARTNPVRSRRRRGSTRRMTTFKGLMDNAFVPAAIGGAGALAVDVAWGLLPVPDTLKTGAIAPFAKMAGAVAVGFAGRAVAGKKIGDQVLVGAITVGAYGLLKNLLQKAAPNIPLGDYGDYEALSYVNAGQFTPDIPMSNVYIPDYEERSNAGMAEYVGEYQHSF